MSRRRAAQKRDILPDAKFNDVTLAKFINHLMYDGKKSIAEKIVYDALESAAVKAESSPIDTFFKALENVKPSIEVRSRRVGGATYQVPVEVRTDRKLVLAMKWIIDSARKRSERDMTSRLSAELVDAFNSRGVSVKKRDDVHKMAEANRAFAHYRW